MNGDVIAPHVLKDYQNRQITENEMNRAFGKSGRIRKVVILPKINETPSRGDLFDYDDHSNGKRRETPIPVNQSENRSGPNDQSISNPNRSANSAFAKQLAAARARSMKPDSWCNDCVLPGAISDNRRTHSLDRYPSKNGSRQRERQHNAGQNDVGQVTEQGKDDQNPTKLHTASPDDTPFIVRLPSINQGSKIRGKRLFLDEARANDDQDITSIQSWPPPHFVSGRCDVGKTFSVTGLLRCAVYFRKREFVTKIILNRNWRAISASGRLEDGEQLMKLETAHCEMLTYAPIGITEKEYLVQLAFDQCGIIVSNDCLDRVKEKRSEWAQFVNKRRLPFRFENREFFPLPPTIDGRVVDVQEFLRSPYDTECPLSSAAALTNYLLSVKADDDDTSVSDGSHGDHQRSHAVRPRFKPVAPVKRRYMVGTILDVSPEVASVELLTNGDSSAPWISFGREAYQPHGRAVADLRCEFSPGDWIALAQVRHKSEERSTWRVVQVRKKEEMKRGYGRFKPLNKEAMSGIIEPRCKTEAGGGNVFFPGAAFREADVLLQNVNQSQWLYYYAFDQKPSARCTAVAVEVTWATAAGIIVKNTDSDVFVWSPQLGLTRGDTVGFPEGTWVQFRFQQQASQWAISDVQMIPPPPKVSIQTDQTQDSNGIILHVRCPAVIGVLTDTYGSVWTEPFGRMALTGTGLKQARNLKASGLQNGQPIRVWATYNGADTECNGDVLENAAAHPRGEAWQVLTCIASNEPVASTAEPAYPPQSIIFGVEAVVMLWEKNEHSGRGQHWIFMSEKYGKIFATPFDLADTQKLISVGDRVQTTIVPQMLVYGEEYRAIAVESV